MTGKHGDDKRGAELAGRMARQGSGGAHRASPDRNLARGMRRASGGGCGATGAARFDAPVYNPAVSVRATLLIAGLAFLTFFVGLGRPAITDSDEAFYAQAGREMVETGDWTTPRYNGGYRFEKPVLFYWLVALGELAARAPSALAGLGLALAAFACARRWYDDETAVLAGAVTATSFGYVLVARQALPDLALAFFITTATWAAFEALVVPQPAGGRRRWLVAAGVALAAGFLTKGPVGLVLPALAVGPPAVWRRVVEARRAGRGPGPFAGLAGDVGLLAAICLALALPWFAAMTATHGAGYLERFFIDENVERFATARYNDPRPFWYYVPIVVGGLLPWSPLMLVWWRPLRRTLAGARRIAPVELWLGLWALAPLVFYSTSVGKQPRYVLPILPPLAILLARAVSRALARQAAGEGARDRLVAAGGTISGLVLMLFAAAAARAGVLLSDGPGTSIRIASLLIALAGLGVVVAALSRRPRRLPVALAAAAVVTTLSLQFSFLSRPGPEPVERMAALVRVAGSDDVPYGRYRVFVRNLLYYVGRPHVDLFTPDQLRAFLASPEPVLCVLTDTDLERARAEGATAYELGRVAYLDVGGLQFRTLLRPDPATDLQTVVLVSNRAPP